MSEIKPKRVRPNKTNEVVAQKPPIATATKDEAKQFQGILTEMVARAFKVNSAIQKATLEEKLQLLRQEQAENFKSLKEDLRFAEYSGFVNATRLGLLMNPSLGRQYMMKFLCAMEFTYKSGHGHIPNRWALERGFAKIDNQTPGDLIRWEPKKVRRLIFIRLKAKGLYEKFLSCTTQETLKDFVSELYKKVKK